MVLVRQTVPADWLSLREIRLQALREAPEAFASTYAREVAFAEAQWRQRAARDGSFLAFLPGTGLTGTGPAGTGPAGIWPAGLAGRPGRPAWPDATSWLRARSSSSGCSSARRPAAAGSARR